VCAQVSENKIPIDSRRLTDMGKRGPIPKSDKERRLEGNPSKRPMKGESPRPRGLPTCPSWLSPEAKQEWRWVAPELARLGLLTKLDRALLAGYCTSCGRWRQAQEAINTHGSVYVTPKGKIVPRPEVTIAKMAEEQMNILAAEFGLSPTSRARLRLPQSQKEEISLLEEMLRENEKGGNK
jgi:P27 family predicted phage terminase small subunit